MPKIFMKKPIGMVIRNRNTIKDGVITLIEAVRENEVLYNLQHRNYRRIDLKEVIWRSIAQKLGTTEEACKRRWKGLRDTYRNAKKKMHQATASGSREVKPWKLFRFMTFLDGYEIRKETSTNYPIEVTKIEDDDDIVVENVEVEPLLSHEPVSPRARSPASSSRESTPHEADILSLGEGPSTRKRQRLDPTRTQFSELLSSFQATLTQAQQTEADPITCFFNLMALKVKRANFSPGVYLDLERDVSNVIYEYMKNRLEDT